MKFLDDHLIGGLVIGVTVGLHFGASLSQFFALFMVGTILVLLRLITAK